MKTRTFTPARHHHHCPRHPDTGLRRFAAWGSTAARPIGRCALLGIAVACAFLFSVRMDAFHFFQGVGSEKRTPLPTPEQYARETIMTRNLEQWKNVDRRRIIQAINEINLLNEQHQQARQQWEESLRKALQEKKGLGQQEWLHDLDVLAVDNPELLPLVIRVMDTDTLTRVLREQKEQGNFIDAFEKFALRVAGDSNEAPIMLESITKHINLIRDPRIVAELWEKVNKINVNNLDENIRKNFISTKAQLLRQIREILPQIIADHLFAVKPETIESLRPLIDAATAKKIKTAVSQASGQNIATQQELLKKTFAAMQFAKEEIEKIKSVFASQDSSSKKFAQASKLLKELAAQFEIPGFEKPGERISSAQQLKYSDQEVENAKEVFKELEELGKNSAWQKTVLEAKSEGVEHLAQIFETQLDITLNTADRLVYERNKFLTDSNSWIPPFWNAVYGLFEMFGGGRYFDRLGDLKNRIREIIVDKIEAIEEQAQARTINSETGRVEIDMLAQLQDNLVGRGLKGQSSTAAKINEAVNISKSEKPTFQAVTQALSKITPEGISNLSVRETKRLLESLADIRNNMIRKIPIGKEATKEELTFLSMLDTQLAVLTYLATRGRKERDLSDVLANVGRGFKNILQIAVGYRPEENIRFWYNAAERSFERQEKPSRELTAVRNAMRDIVKTVIADPYEKEKEEKAAEAKKVAPPAPKPQAVPAATPASSSSSPIEPPSQQEQTVRSVFERAAARAAQQEAAEGEEEEPVYRQTSRTEIGTGFGEKRPVPAPDPIVTRSPTTGEQAERALEALTPQEHTPAVVVAATPRPESSAQAAPEKAALAAKLQKEYDEARDKYEANPTNPDYSQLTIMQNLERQATAQGITLKTSRGGE